MNRPLYYLFPAIGLGIVVVIVAFSTAAIAPSTPLVSAPGIICMIALAGSISCLIAGLVSWGLLARRLRRSRP